MTIFDSAGLFLDRVFRRTLEHARNAYAALGALTAVALVVTAVGLTLFGWIAVEVHEHEADLLDRQLLLLVGAHRTADLTAVMRAASYLGGQLAIPCAILLVLLLYWRGRPRAAALYLWAVSTGWALNGLTKWLFHRARPTVIPRLSSAGWYSFPSGHSMMAPLVFGLAALLLVREFPSKGWRVSGFFAVSGVVLLIGFSRVYLGVHYPSDVIGALLAGTGWGALWVLAAEAQRR